MGLNVIRPYFVKFMYVNFILRKTLQMPERMSNFDVVYVFWFYWISHK
jgi:hypothetical protein